jgi:hypothetical protein
LLGLTACPAATYVWDGGTSGLGTSWNSAANWQGDQLPAQSAQSDLHFTSRNGGGTLLPQMSLSSNRTAGRILFDGQLGSLPELLVIDANGAGGSTARVLTLHSGLTLANTHTQVLFRGANGGLTLALGANNHFETAPNALLHLQTPITGAHGLTLDGNVRLDAASSYSGGTIVQTGLLLLGNSSGSATGTGVFHLTAGAHLAGNGRIAPAGAAPLTLAGSLSPGLPDVDAGLGTLILAPELGDAVFSSTASLIFELGPDGSSDRLVFTSQGSGQLDLSALVPGSLKVVWATGAEPAPDTVFDLLDWSALSGSGITGLDPRLLDLPTDGFAANWQWDVSAFSATGRIAIIPEPSRATLLVLATLAALRRRRSPAGTGHKTPGFTTGTVDQPDLAVMTGTDQQEPLPSRPQQQGGGTITVDREPIRDLAGLPIQLAQRAVSRRRHGTVGPEIAEPQHLGTTRRTQRSLLLRRAVEIPAPHLAITAAGYQSVRTKGNTQHRHAVAGEGAFDDPGVSGEHLGRAIAAGSGNMLAIGTHRQGQHPVGMRFNIPDLPPLGQGKTAHPVVGTTGDQKPAVGRGHGTEGTVAQAGESAALFRFGIIHQPDLPGAPRRTTSHRQQRAAGNKTQAQDALGQIANARAPFPVLGIPGQHLVITAGDQHLAVAIERQGCDRQRPRVALRSRLARCLFHQSGQRRAPVPNIKDRPGRNPGAQELHLPRRQRIGLLRHAILLVMGEEEAHDLPLLRLASHQGRLAAVARSQQLLDRVQAVRSLGLLRPMALQALIDQNRHNLADKRHRLGRERGGEGEKQADEGFHGRRNLRGTAPRFHRASSKSMLEGIRHRRLKGPRAVATKAFIQRLQPLDQIRHLAPRQHAAGSHAKMGATAKGTELIDGAAPINPERRAGPLRMRLELLAPGGTHPLGGKQGLTTGQDGHPTGLPELAAASQRLAIALDRAVGQIPVNGAHLGEGVSKTGGSWPAGHRAKRVERVVGIEPTWPAWKAGTLPLSYTRRLLGSRPST